MNYYERHLGDYARDAGHLTMLEHGAYTLLLDRYYTTEQGIPADQAHRVCRARTRDEKAAVDAVLAEFFTLIDGIWCNGRAGREVEKMRSKVEAARTNGKRGGRPKGSVSETQQKPTGLLVGSELVTQAKAHQTPDTNTNTPPPPKGGAEPAGFAEFWNSWPTSERKVARKQCAVKWQRKGFNTQLPAIVAHVEAMKQSKQWREGFEPAPLTYLNQERWGDGLPADSDATSEAGFI